MGYDLNNLGKHAQAAARGGVRKIARAKRDRPEDHLSAALNALLYGIRDPRQPEVWLLEPGVRVRGQAFHVPNERAAKSEAKRLKWVGVKPGVADWIFTGPPVLGIELKWGKNKPIANQVEWGKGLEAGWDQIGLTEGGCPGVGLDMLKRLFGPKYFVCRSLTILAAVLWDHDLILEPETLEGLGQALEAVRHYWLFKYRREIP